MKLGSVEPDGVVAHAYNVVMAEELLASELDENAIATTERGSRLEKYTEADVNLGLRLLILNGGDVNKTSELLAEEMVIVTPAALRYWRDTAFQVRHHNLRQELGRDVGEDVAGRAMERARQADSVTETLIDRLKDKVKDLEAKDLAPSARALSQVQDNAVKNAQLLRDKPTEIKETRSVPELVGILVRMGVADNKQSVIVDGKAEELEDGIGE